MMTPNSVDTTMILHAHLRPLNGLISDEVIQTSSGRVLILHSVSKGWTSESLMSSHSPLIPIYRAFLVEAVGALMYTDMVRNLCVLSELF